MTGVLVSPNKTAQGIYAAQVGEANTPGYRARHEAGFEAGGDAEEVLRRHRELIAPEQRRRGREGMSLEWTLVHQERGPHIEGTTKSYDYGEKRMGRFQTVGTGGSAHRQLMDGIAGQSQEPKVCKEEEAYLQATVQVSYAQREQARTRLLALLPHVEPRLAYKNRTAIVGEVGAP